MMNGGRLPSEPLDEAALKAIDARADAAHPGPWYCAREHVEDGTEVFSIYSRTLRCGRRSVRALHVAQSCEPEASFIAYARTDVPALTAAVRARDAIIARLRKDADRWRAFRLISGLTVTEDGEVVLSATLFDSTSAEDAPFLTDTERRALDGALTRADEKLGMRNGWVWESEALDRAVDAAIAAVVADGEPVDDALPPSEA